MTVENTTGPDKPAESAEETTRRVGIALEEAKQAVANLLALARSSAADMGEAGQIDIYPQALTAASHAVRRLFPDWSERLRLGYAAMGNVIDNLDRVRRLLAGEEEEGEEEYDAYEDGVQVIRETRA